MKLLKEVWLTEDSSESLLTHISDVQDRLRKVNDMAQTKLRDTQKQVKTWYDRKARTRIFHSGDQVLVLLPIHGSHLQAQYWGPYTAEKKTSDVDYVINTLGRRKSKHLCHVNMLKPYHSKDNSTACRPVANVASVSDCPPDDSVNPSDPVEKPMKLQNSDVFLNLDRKLNLLPEEERAVIKQIVEEFVNLFPDVPGRTIAAHYDVEVGDTYPIKQHP